MKILKILMMAIIGITLVISPAYGAHNGGHNNNNGNNNGNGNGGNNNNNGNANGGNNNNNSNNGRGNGSVGKDQGQPNSSQARKARAAERASEPERRRKQIERRRKQADTRANRPKKEKQSQRVGHTELRAKRSAKRDRGRSVDHGKVKENSVASLFKALGKARWSHNPQDERGEGNMGKPNMRDPNGLDKDSGREKRERGRPIREKQEESSLFDLAGIVGVDFTTQDDHLNFLNMIYDRYQSTIQQLSVDSSFYNLYSRVVSIYEYLINDYVSSNTTRVRVNQSDTINYNMTLSPPEGFEGTTLIVTTTLTSVNNYDYRTWFHSYDPDTRTWDRRLKERHYDAGQAVMAQTQEVVMGTDNTFSFNWDPPHDFAGLQGFYGDLSVTVTEPISGQSYTTTYDKSLYLYRRPYGKVTNAKTGQPIVGTKITVYFEDGSIVPLDKALNPTATNPQITDATGRYGVKLQADKKYYITAKAPGYKLYKSEIFTEEWDDLRGDIKLNPVEQSASSE
jgi:hypothetical protein